MEPYFVLAGCVAVASGFNRALLATVNASRRDIARGRPFKHLNWSPVDVFILAGLIVFAALRWHVGRDFGLYESQFTRLQPGDWAGWQEQIAAAPSEVGYTLLSLAIRQYSETIEPLLWATSILTIVPIYMALKKQSRDITTSLVLYILLAFFAAPFNIIRQGIAIGLNFYAHTFIDKNKKAFIILNALAACFHVTALFAAVIQFLLYRKGLSPKWWIVLMGGAFASMAALQAFPTLTEGLAFFNERYEAYVEEESGAGLGTYLLIAAHLGLTVYGLALGRTPNSRRYALYAVAGSAFLIIGTQAVVIGRMDYYFSIFMLLLIPNQIADRRDRVIHKAVLYAAGSFILAQYLANWGDLIPYQTQ